MFQADIQADIQDNQDLKRGSIAAEDDILMNQVWRLTCDRPNFIRRIVS